MTALAPWPAGAGSLPSGESLTSPGDPATVAQLPPRGRRRRTAPVDSGILGWCYLIHLDTPIGAGRPRVTQAQHYVGWAGPDRLRARLAADLGGYGCRLVAYALRAGIRAELVRLWRGDRNRERALKQNSATRYCPVCTDLPKVAAACAADRRLARLRAHLRST
jgi:hypothetical protein